MKDDTIAFIIALFVASIIYFISQYLCKGDSVEIIEIMVFTILVFVFKNDALRK